MIAAKQAECKKSAAEKDGQVFSILSLDIVFLSMYNLTDQSVNYERSAQ
jgi:hypothetical protein